MIPKQLDCCRRLVYAKRKSETVLDRGYTSASRDTAPQLSPISTSRPIDCATKDLPSKLEPWREDEVLPLHHNKHGVPEGYSGRPDRNRTSVRSRVKKWGCNWVAINTNQPNCPHLNGCCVLQDLVSRDGRVLTDANCWRPKQKVWLTAIRGRAFKLKLVVPRMPKTAKDSAGNVSGKSQLLWPVKCEMRVEVQWPVVCDDVMVNKTKLTRAH